MWLIISELLLIWWLVYVIKRVENFKWKVLIICIVTIGEILKVFALFMGIFNHNILFLALGYFIMQMILLCLYKIDHVSLARLVIGFAILVILGYYMYYNGGVRGPMSYYTNDAGGLVQIGNYQIYRWTMYSTEVVFPFAFIFNLLVSPFWKREDYYLDTNEL